MKHLTRLRVITDAQEAFFPKLAHLLQTSPSSTDVLDMVLATEQRNRGFVALFGDLCRKGILRSVSIVARIQPGLSNIRPQLGRASFAWNSSQLLTTLKVASPEHGTEVDVRAICEAVTVSCVLTQLEIELLTLKEQYAEPIQKMLCSTKTLKRFGLDYNDVEKLYKTSFYQRHVDSLIPQYMCFKCRTIHILETSRIMPWIEALLRVNSSVNKLRFSMFAFCTLDVAYPDTVRVPEHIPGHFVNVPCADLERTLWEAAVFGLAAHVHLSVSSVLCLTSETDPAASPLVQWIREAPALVTVDIRIEDSCCSRCWNRLAPPLFDAVLHHTGIQTLAIRLPKKSAMDLLPLADLLHRNPRLFKFVLEPPGPEVFGEFLREASKPMLWDNYNLADVDLRCDAPEQLERMLRMKEVADRNSTLAMRAARFVGGMRNSENARALETMLGSRLLVKKVCAFLHIDKQQALDRIDACLSELEHMT
ncbi:hypothetical protein MTO96_014773 [Rhipicephalus appendiculatus]